MLWNILHSRVISVLKFVCAWCQQYPQICFSARISLPTTFLSLTQSVFMLPASCFSSFSSSPDTSPLTLVSPLPLCSSTLSDQHFLSLSFHSLLLCFYQQLRGKRQVFLLCVCSYAEGTMREEELHLLLPSPIPWWQHQAKLTHCCCFQRCFHGRYPLCSSVHFSTQMQMQTSFFLSFLI